MSLHLQPRHHASTWPVFHIVFPTHFSDRCPGQSEISQRDPVAVWLEIALCFWQGADAAEIAFVHPKHIGIVVKWKEKKAWEYIKSKKQTEADSSQYKAFSPKLFLHSARYERESPATFLAMSPM